MTKNFCDMKTFQQIMNRKMLVLLTLLFCVGTLSVNAVTEYNVYVAGVQVTSANASNIVAPGGSGCYIEGVSYDAQTNTLTLDNAIIRALDGTEDEYGSHGIKYLKTSPDDKNLTIRLIGKSIIETDYESIYVKDVLTFVSGNPNPSRRPVLQVKVTDKNSFPFSGIMVDVQEINNYQGAELSINNCDIDVESKAAAVSGFDNYPNHQYAKLVVNLLGNGTLRAKTRSTLETTGAFNHVADIRIDNNSDNSNIQMPRNVGYSSALENFTLDGYNPYYPKEVRLSSHIQFEDSKVKQLCVGNWDENGDGNLDFIEARRVESLGLVFNDNKDIKKFNELMYFTGIETFSGTEFDACENLTEIELPYYLKTIGYYSLRYLKHLQILTIPPYVETIENFAVYDCSRLSSVVFEPGSKLKSIGGLSFGFCPITDMKLPYGLKTIANNAFYSNKLKTIELPETVTEIGEAAFYNGASELTTVIMHSKTPPTIGRNAFEIIDGFRILVPKSYQGDMSAINAYRNAWTQYADYIEGWMSYDIVIAGEELGTHNIGAEGEFSYYNGNTLVTGVKYDTRTGELTLDNALIRYDNPNDVAIKSLWAKDITLKVNGECRIEAAGTGISSSTNVFVRPYTYDTYVIAAAKLILNAGKCGIIFDNSDCGAMPSLRFNNVKVEMNVNNGPCVDGGPYYYDEEDPTGFQPGMQASVSFEKVKMVAKSPGNVVFQNAWNYSFEECRMVSPAGYTTPDGATDEVRIGNWISFYDHDVETICLENWDTNHDGGLDEWEAADVETIGTHFQGNEDIESFGELDYFTGITEIPDNAFSGCTALEWINIPKNVKRIGNYAFYGANLFCPDVPGGVEEIGDYAYHGSYWESNFSLPYSVKTIGEGAFAGCLSMGGVWFNEQNQDKYQLEYIGDYAFAGTYDSYGEGPVNIIPQSVKYIGAHAFDGSGPNMESCLYLTVYGTKPPVIGEHAFGETPLYEDSYIYVPAGRVSIYKSAWAEYKDYIVGEDAPTSIAGVTVGKQRSGVYTLDGRFLRKGSSTEGLAKGIYIVNGKKVAVK